MTRRRKQRNLENARKAKNSKQKSKQAKGDAGKKKKKNGDTNRGPELEDELHGKGLRVKYMMADGNCFFRSLGDQLYGHDRDHLVIRLEVLSFMESNRELFQPFVDPCLEEDEDFDSYILQMKQAGDWAGDFEVHAASLCFNVDICIYQIDSGSLQCLYNKSPLSTRVLHISYHGGEHYNSVRKSDDYDEKLPALIDLSSSSNGKKWEWTWKDEKRIMEETGCFNDGLIHCFLEQFHGNVKEVIEEVYSWMDENGMAHEKVESDENNPLDVQNVFEEEEEEEVEENKETTLLSEPSSSNATTKAMGSRDTYTSTNVVLREDVAITRTKKPENNKPCPCGSNQVYKKCCKVVDKKREREKKAKLQDSLTSSEPITTCNNELTLLYI